MLRCMVVVFLGLVMVSCSENNPTSPSPHGLPDTQTLNEVANSAYIYGSASGNRVTPGTVDLSNAVVQSVDLSDHPAWVVGASFDEKIIWAAVLLDGTVQGFEQTDTDITAISISPDRLPKPPDETSRPNPPPVPPVLVIDTTGKPVIANVFEADASLYTSSVIVDKSTGNRVYVSSQGELVRYRDGEVEQRLAVDAMPNSRMVKSNSGLLAVLAGNGSDVYGHDVLGNDLSVATKIMVVSVEPQLSVVSEIELQAGEVFEGNALFWADMDQDGSDELVTTVTDSAGHAYARIDIYTDDGSPFVQGPPIDTPYIRWRHLIGAAGFQGSTHLAIASTLFPHLTNPQSELFFYGDTGLIQTQAELNLTSHKNASSNIDMAHIIDNPDGGATVVIPERGFGALSSYSQYSDQGELRCCRSASGGNGLDWGEGIQNTNLAVVDHNNRIHMAVGLTDNRLVFIH